MPYLTLTVHRDNLSDILLQYKCLQNAELQTNAEKYNRSEHQVTKCQKDLVSNNHIQLQQQCTTPQWNVSSLSCSTCQSINKSHNYYFQSFFKCCHSGICVIVLQGTETPLTMPGEITAPTRHWQEINISWSSNSQPRGVLNQTKTTKARQKLLEATSWLELWQLKQALSNTPHPVTDQRLLTPNSP